MATHSNILAWRIPWTEEPGGLQSQRVRHDRSNLASTQDFDHQRREASYYCWKMVLAESDTTEHTHMHAPKIQGVPDH